MSTWIKTRGTQTGEFQLGFDGPKLNNLVGTLQVLDSSDAAATIVAGTFAAEAYVGSPIFEATFTSGQGARFSFIDGDTGDLRQTGMYGETQGNIIFKNNNGITLYLYANNDAEFSGSVVASGFSGDASSLSNITGANVSGNVGSATVAYSVDGANVIGTVGSATVAYSVDGANVSGTVESANIANSVAPGSQFNLLYHGASANGDKVEGIANIGFDPNQNRINSYADIHMAGGGAANFVAEAGHYFVGDGSYLTGVSVAGANVSGEVANATFATTSGSSYSVAGGNVSGTVGSASVAYSVDGANVSGTVGSASVAYSVSGANVVGEVERAMIASVAELVEGQNVQGPVANAIYADTAGQSNVANIAYSVDGANVNGTVGSASYAYSVDGANVSGTVASAADATRASFVTNATQGNITSVGTLTSLNVSGDAVVNGNLSVTGNLQYLNVVDLRVQDPIIEQGGGANGDPLTTNDGMDRGQILHYYTTGTVDAFMGWKNSASEFQFGSNVSISNNIVTINTLGNVRAEAYTGSDFNAVRLNLTATGGVITDGETTIPGTGSVKTIELKPYTTGDANQKLVVYPTLNEGNHIHLVSGNLETTDIFLGDDARFIRTSNTGSMIIGTNVTPGSPSSGYQWSFDNAGNLILPGNTFAINYANGNPVIIDNVANANYASYAGQVVDASQGNITSLGTLTGLTVSGTSDLGDVGNVKIAGGSSGYVMTTDGAGNLTWEATQSIGDTWKSKSISFNAASGGTLSLMTLPANAIVDKVSIIVDTAFNGTSPTVTVGVNGGSGFEYAAAGDVNLLSTGRYDVPSEIAPQGSSQTLNVYLSAGGSGSGEGRVIITYSIPA